MRVLASPAVGEIRRHHLLDPGWADPARAANFIHRGWVQVMKMPVEHLFYYRTFTLKNRVFYCAFFGFLSGRIE
jgi:hypothetical protein